VITAIFFDAMGTLITLKCTVGENYAYVGEQIGLGVDAAAFDRAFQQKWCTIKARAPISGPREDDDKDWWRKLVFQLLDKVAPQSSELDRDNFFELAYEHFAAPSVWQLHPDATDVITGLYPRFRLAIVSNWDGRLRFVLEHLGIGRFFEQLFISSEVGADKPDPEIFRRALRLMKLSPTEVLHVGDDPHHDWAAAEACGLRVFRLDHRERHLRGLLELTVTGSHRD
jgi:putative hydrolase of the HAD superfamily